MKLYFLGQDPDGEILHYWQFLFQINLLFVMTVLAVHFITGGGI